MRKRHLVDLRVEERARFKVSKKNQKKSHKGMEEEEEEEEKWIEEVSIAKSDIIQIEFKYNLGCLVVSTCSS